MGIKHITSGNMMKEELLAGASPLCDQLLIAMPNLRGDIFSKSVVYMCAHSPAGAMGIVINQKLPEIKFSDLLGQLSLPNSELRVDPVVHFGGPVESGRGFVLHSTDFMRKDTLCINKHIGLTGTVDILQAISRGDGPRNSIFALGYAGWGPGQLESELQANSWLTLPAEDDLIFSKDLGGMWEMALQKLGADPAALSPEAGHA